MQTLACQLASDICLIPAGAALGIDHRKDVTERSVVAVKTLKTDCNDDNKEEFYQEVALMSVLDHPNVVKLMAVATEEEPLCMIFEFMEFGDLNQFLRRIRPLDDAEEAPGKKHDEIISNEIVMQYSKKTMVCFLVLLILL